MDTRPTITSAENVNTRPTMYGGFFFVQLSIQTIGHQICIFRAAGSGKVAIFATQNLLIGNYRIPGLLILAIFATKNLCFGVFQYQFVFGMGLI